MESVLKKMSAKLNDNDILWGIGASLVLKSYGLVEESHDIDIIIAPSDINRALEVLDSIGTRQEVPLKKEYKTEHFYVYDIDGISIDVMSSFRITHSKGVYEFILDEKAITRVDIIDGIPIPYTGLEDWFVAYSLMIGRGKKVEMIRDYLSMHGCMDPELLVRALDQSLPKRLTDDIRMFLA